jgi:hypothetical protein
MQQAQLDYLADPGPTNALIVELVQAYQTGWTYSPGVADFAVRTMREQGLVINDPASGVFGQFDPARMEQIVATFRGVAAGAGHDHADPGPGRPSTPTSSSTRTSAWADPDSGDDSSGGTQRCGCGSRGRPGSARHPAPPLAARAGSGRRRMLLDGGGH